MVRRKSKASWGFWKIVAVVLIVIAVFFFINWYTVRVLRWDMFSWLIDAAHNPPTIGGP